MSDQQSEAREAVRDAKVAYDQARSAFFGAIKKALAAGVGPSDLSRDSGFTREYVAKIRDGKGPKGT
ncbi:hypothetical protein OG596_38255 (plasmid) [Streptomyces sp. NBC_01102]|uniref:hypothetical protein n=1 Tax=Streptomyces sp. NBC_01102 TaxID=2903749 RepID=UPI002F910EDF|nr:hypothetical protein OG596_38255 [Streptomyces sp. NBC_01102]